MTGLSIPSAVRSRAVSQGAEQWLTDLDDVVDRLCADWGVAVQRVLDGGTTALVTTVVDRNRPERQAVLKISLPGLGFDDQLRTLERADGHGFVRVYRSAPESDAALLERLGAPLAETTTSAVDPLRQIAQVCDLLPVAWQPVVDDRLDQGWDKQDWDKQDWDKAGSLAELVTELWQRHHGLCPERVIEHALDCAQRRATAVRSDWVLVHGDPHPANTLRVLRDRPGAVGGYVFVDPEGFWADPCYDVGVLLRDWSDDLIAADDPRAMMHRFCAVAARRTGLDPDAIADWAFLERVSSGLFVTDVVGADEGGRFLRAATRLMR